MSPLFKQCIGTKHHRCTELIPIGIKRCSQCAHREHLRRADRPTTRTRTAIYRDPQWQHTRAAVLARDRHCVLCGAPPTTVDHYPTPVLECPDPYDPEACRALCTTCSGREDGKRSRGGGHPAPREPSNPSPNPLATEIVVG